MKRDIFGAAVRYILLMMLLILLLIITASKWILAGIALMIILPIASWISNFYLRKHIKAAVRIPTTTAKNAAVAATVDIKNDGWLPVLKAHCKIGIINDLTGEEETVNIYASVGPKQKQSQTFLLESEFCGRLYIPVKSLVIFDYFGLIPTRVPVKSAVRMTVLPDLFPLEADLLARVSSSDEGIADRKGDDRSEIFQLREYQSGDDVRQIHWKLSSKLDQLILKEASAPQSRSLMVFWDKRIPGTPAQMDALAEAVSSVCQALVDKGYLFHLYWTEREELQMSDIADENSLLQAIPALVKNTGTPECQEPDMGNYSRVLYFSAFLPEGTENNDQLHVMLCSDSAVEEQNITVFTPENYREVLQRLEI